MSKRRKALTGKRMSDRSARRLARVGRRNLPESLEGRTLFASIAGSVYLDSNNSGTRQEGEPGLTGWQVYLDLDNSATLTDADQVTTTDTAGNFAFANLA